MGVPLLSVIIPLYNSTKYFTRCVEGICSQTTADKIEVILVDDGSTDNSLELAKTIFVQRKFTGRVLSLRQDSNQGVAYARKLGVSRATGKYITFCDSDDWIDKTIYEKMLSTIIDGNYDLVVCDFFNIYPNGASSVTSPCCIDDLLSGLLTCKVSGCLWNKMIKREILTYSNFIFPERSFCEDVVYSVQFAIFASRIGYVKEPLYYYCHRDGSIVQAMDDNSINRRLEDNLINFQLINSILIKNGLAAKYKSELIALKLVVKNSIRRYFHLPGYRKLWHKTFPELSYQIFWSPCISWRSRIAYYLTFIGLYHSLLPNKNA